MTYKPRRWLYPLFILVPVVVIALVVIFMFVLTQGRDAAASLLLRGNRTVIDTTYTYDRATIALQDGTVVTGTVDTWLDYEDSDMMQIVVEGSTYLIHGSNCTLIKD